jgi:hypothetical protein
MAKKAPYPTLYGIVRVRITPRHKGHKVRQFVLAIRKRIRCHLRLDLQIGEVRWRVLQPYITRKGEFLGARVKPGNSNEIAEDVVQPADVRGLGSDRQRLFEHFLVIPIAWAKHHAMVAKPNRHAVTIDRDVSNSKDRHLIYRSKVLRFLPYMQTPLLGGIMTQLYPHDAAMADLGDPVWRPGQ